MYILISRQDFLNYFLLDVEFQLSIEHYVSTYSCIKLLVC